MNCSSCFLFHFDQVPHNFTANLSSRQNSRNWQVEKRLDLTETIKDGARMFLIDAGIRRQLIMALTEDSKLHIQEV